ncbi:hypothetical protein AUK22_04610 [bacterium CG2_30_54_10]|nr:MAG: hypothetical protein AUK22_04610 [bacterium CG2_30_54_10]
MSQTPAKGWRETLNISIQLIVLMVSLFLGFEAWLDNRLANNRETFAAECRNIVEKLAIQTDPEFFTQTRIRRLFHPWNTASLPKLRGSIEKLRSVWSLQITAFVFNQAGDLIESLPANAPNQWIMKQLYQGLNAKAEALLNNFRRKIDKKIPFLFGDGRDLAILRRDKGKAIEVFSKTGQGYFLWNRWPQGGIMLHCPILPAENAAFSNFLAGRTSNSLSAKFSGLGNQNSDSWKRFGSSDDPLAGPAWKAIQHTQTQDGESEGYWWSFLETTSGRIVYAAFQPPLDAMIKIRTLVRVSGFIGLIGGLSLIFGFGISAGLTLRKILLGLFLAAALIPLLGIALGSLDIVQVFQTVLGTRIQAVQDEAIRNVAQEFNGFVASCAVSVRAITSHPAGLANEAGRQEMFRRLHKRKLVNVLQMRDAGGHLLFSQGTDFGGTRETMVRAMARRSVERYFPERIDEASYPANVFADNMVRRDDMGFSTFLNHPGQLQTLQMGATRFLFFFLNPPKGVGPVAYVDVLVSLSKMVSNYLQRRNTRRLAYEGVWMRFYALEVPDFRWTIPPPGNLAREINQMAFASWITGRPINRSIGQPGSGGFAVAIPCPELSNHCLIAFYPDDLLRERIQSVWRKISLGALFFFGLIGLMGFGISRQFLSPLGHLEEAVTALTHRDFDFRLPVAGNDEIAHLFAAFNEMMIDSHDLQLARSVQEGLVPQTFPQPPGYSLHGRLETASDLGGDCLDCFILAGDRIVFLVGDITGHGVGSALLMAFSRAITFHWSQGQALYPDSLTTDLDRMLRRKHAARQFSGVVCGILDPSSHTLDLVVRGNIYPLFISSDGSCKWIGSTSSESGNFPASAEPGPIRMQFQPDERLVCLTDGFVEAHNHSGKEIGHLRVGEWACALRKPGADDWISALFTKHAEWCGPLHEDDLTAFAIIRKPVEPEAAPSSNLVAPAAGPAETSK